MTTTSDKGRREALSLEAIGAEIRSARQARSLTLGGLGRLTRIPASAIERIETGRIEDLPGEVYVRGFLKSIARELGLDAAALAARFGPTGPSSVPPAPESMRFVEEQEHRRTRRWGIALAVLIVVLLAAVLYSIVRGAGPSLAV